MLHSIVKMHFSSEFWFKYKDQCYENWCNYWGKNWNCSNVKIENNKNKSFKIAFCSLQVMHLMVFFFFSILELSVWLSIGFMKYKFKLMDWNFHNTASNLRLNCYSFVNRKYWFFFYRKDKNNGNIKTKMKIRYS